LRARAVVSYNPSVYQSDLEQHWFDFEARLYACRLWTGTVQELSQEVEQVLSSYFASEQAKFFYEEGVELQPKDFDALRTALSAKFNAPVDLTAQQDVLDMGQFRDVRPPAAEAERPPKRNPKGPSGPGLGPGGVLVLAIDFVKDEESGMAVKQLCAGDLVYTTITDPRDIAQYLSKLFGARSEEGPTPLPVPVEAIERDEKGAVAVRVRFSAGVCGDLSLGPDEKIRAIARPSNLPWWKKIFGRA
jgi:hypothetical protein